MVTFCLLKLLRSLLEDRVNRLHGQLQRTQQHLMASSDLGSVDRKVLDDLYEDIHWLILVSGLQLDGKLVEFKKERMTDGSVWQQFSSYWNHQ